MEEKFNNKYRVNSVRKDNWNYGSNGGYFVTICTKNMVRYFGEIVETQNFASLRATLIGEIAKKFWEEIPQHFPDVILDEYIIMPNHNHAILLINKEEKDVNRDEYKNKFGPQSRNLSSIVRGYKVGEKTFATKNNIPFEWQKGYYDRIIRNEDELLRIRKYINENAYKNS